ncbi:alpha/beta hydrolase [Mesorhizobium sp. M0051]|uniref:alpha/beta fold hydrolase n=1 Tax=unclassified Mesorhizobium TaxID=325217 RepID=UPI0003CE3ABA|nr:alpha/beta hydrolase [Mesorhizobium sp. LNHC252B00]ESY72759.1 alpha/beta hydrolase [Mesorhizobium sp. LNHC252B00]
MLTSPRPNLLQISDTLTLRYEKTGNGPPLVLMHTIRTQLEYFRGLAPLLAESYTVYAIDLPGHGHSPIDPLAPFDEPYFRQGVIGFIEKLNLTDVTLVGESIGGALALTVAAAIPQRVKRVFASNPYDYETRYGDGLRRGNWLANFIIGSLQVPVLGPFNAWMENQMVLGKIMGGGYHDPRKLPSDLLAEFGRVAKRPGYKRIARKVLAGWRSWSAARDRYRLVSAPVTLIYGDSDWSRPDERERTRALLPNARMFTLKNTGHFSAVENPSELARIILGSTG